MRFTSLTLAAFCAFTSIHAADLTPSGVVMSIEEITDISSDINDILQKSPSLGNAAKTIPVRSLPCRKYLRKTYD